MYYFTNLINALFTFLLEALRLIPEKNIRLHPNSIGFIKGKEKMSLRCCLRVNKPSSSFSKASTNQMHFSSV